MSGLERRLQRALTLEATGVDPATDLFARVTGDVQADRLRRRLRRRAAVTGLVSTLALGMAGAAAGWWPTMTWWADNGRGGRSMSWWVLEAVTTAVLVGLALWLGPFIKRFGRAYAADVFHDNPMTGKSYIVLTDIVYYLIFTAYILFTIRFEPGGGWAVVVGPDQLRHECARIGGILLVLGALHGVNIVLMPVLGRLFSLNRRLRPATDTSSGQFSGESPGASPEN